MAFNDGLAYHGSEAISGGKLMGTTDTDYFYFFCPRCPPRQIMRPLDFEVRAEGPGGQRYPDQKPKQSRDFTLAFRLHCSGCGLIDFVKISNVGWQGGVLPVSDLPAIG